MPLPKKKGALKAEEQRMYSEKRITEKKLGTIKSLKSIRSITFKARPEVFEAKAD